MIRVTDFYRGNDGLPALAGIIFGVIALTSLAFAIYVRLQPPTVIRVDKDGNAAVVGAARRGPSRVFSFSPEAAVLLNLSEDHLDRHPSFDDYVRAKLRVFANQGNDDVAVAPVDIGVQDLGGCARRVTFGDGPEAECSAQAGHLWWDQRPLVRF